MLATVLASWPPLRAAARLWPAPLRGAVEPVRRWFDGRDWFGPGVTLVSLCENPLHIRKWDKVNDVCWWQPLTLEQNEQLINAGVLDEFVRHFN